MRRPSLRWMMLVPTIATITVGLVVFGIYLDRVQRDSLLDDIDAELIRAERSIVGPRAPAGTQPDEDDDGDGVDPPTQLLVTSDGDILAEGGGTNPFDHATLTALAAETGTFTVDEPRYRVRTAEREDGNVAITALPLAQFDQAVSDFRRTLLAGGLVILALEIGVVWFLAVALTRPVTRMAATATRIADGATDTEIDPPSGSRETAELAGDLRRMVDRLRATIDDRERSATEATRARDDMRRFLADMSHELRTPLTALKGYSDLYAGNMLDEPGALDRAMGRIGDESERLNALVSDMLQLAREASIGDQPEIVDASEIVRVVVDDLRAAHAGVGIELGLAPTTDAVVLGQPGPLHQAILNLGSNACQHSPTGATVEFRVHSTDTDLVIEVVDHGPGIDPDEVGKIFLPFYRHDTSRGRDGRGGAGLGLAITHQIAERHSGSVDVAATPGGGATFTLSVPLAEATSGRP